MGKKAIKPEQIEFRRAVGRQLNIVLTAAGIDQKVVARKIGVGTSTLNQWFTGAARADVEAMCRFCEAFNVTLDYIYRGKTEFLTGTRAKELEAAEKKYDEGLRKGLAGKATEAPKAQIFRMGQRR